jgi:uncharacterized membrane protein (UPF0127 family)
VRITNATRGTELARDARTARSLLSRAVGLLGRASLPPGEALVLERTGSVHTAFMRFAIDVLYVDRAGSVVKAVAALRPFRVSGVLKTGCTVIELPSGTIGRTATAPGDQLAFEP